MKNDVTVPEHAHSLIVRDLPTHNHKAYKVIIIQSPPETNQFTTDLCVIIAIGIRIIYLETITKLLNVSVAVITLASTASGVT